MRMTICRLKKIGINIIVNVDSFDGFFGRRLHFILSFVLSFVHISVLTMVVIYTKYSHFLLLTAVGSVCIAVLIPSLMAVNRFIRVVPLDVDVDDATADDCLHFVSLYNTSGNIRLELLETRRLRLKSEDVPREIINLASDRERGEIEVS